MDGQFKNHIHTITLLLLLPLIVILVKDDLFPPEQESGVPVSGLIPLNMDEEMSIPAPAVPDASIRDVVESLQQLGPINSILISQNGEYVVEEYFRGMNRNSTHNIKSASKSILSILIGIAIDKGYLEGVDQEIGEFFPDYFDRNSDPEKAAITIGDLLTMRAGLRSTSGGNYGPWVVSNNWIHYALSRPMVGEPGVDRIYSTGTTHLLGVVLTRASGLSLRDFANHYLFGPMGIRIGGWDIDPQGYYLGGNNMALRPSDMVKIGQLMMNVGSWNGEQLVPKEWVYQSIEPVTGRTSVNNYGYLWFRRMAGDYHVVYAWGNGSQYIKIVPELDSVVVVTTRNQSGATRSYRNRLISTLDDEIIPHLTLRSQSGSLSVSSD